MPLLSLLARIFLLRRLFGGGRHARRRHAYGPGYGARRRRPSSGFGFHGPFPAYSRRTRGGGRVSVTGCCLPIPLALAGAAAVAGRLLHLRR